jgi:predicted transcriptional regulator
LSDIFKYDFRTAVRIGNGRVPGKPRPTALPTTTHSRTTKIFVDFTKVFVHIAAQQEHLAHFAMPKHRLPKPTDGELAILGVLWRHGPRTVREIHSEFNRTRQTGYTTVLKMLQIMAEKGLVTRDETRKTHVYEAALAQKEAQRWFVGDLLDRVFNGSAHRLVLQALSAKKASPAELAEIRQLLDDMEKGRK